MKILREIAILIALGAGILACDVPSGAPKAPSIVVSL
jgi:hypothetical protein